MPRWRPDATPTRVPPKAGKRRPGGRAHLRRRGAHAHGGPGHGRPRELGLRLFTEPGEDGESSLAIAFRESPEMGDAITEQAGLQLFVAPASPPGAVSIPLKVARARVAA